MAKRTAEQLRTNIFVNGVEIPILPLKMAPDDHIRDILAMKIRDDDVLLAAYPKCGTHWVWEVVQMLLNKTTVHESKAKEHDMMEFCPVSHLDAQDSPRILNSHLFFAHLPEEILAKKTKILHVVRNPKDILVSMYFHFSSFADFTWQSLLDEFLEKKGNLAAQFSYLRQMVEFQKKHPDHPVMLVYYEDMKKNPAKVITEIAKFLDVSVTDAFCQDVADACDFTKLKEVDTKKDKPEHLKQFSQGMKKSSIYRKGVIGDWKNQFTVAQNEMFDAFIEEEMKDLPFTFTYE